MRLKIRHETIYGFETPPSSVVQTLRLTPRSFDGQHVVRWRLDVDRNCRLRSSEDAFGNLTHVFMVDGPLDSLAVLVEGEVDTQEVNGVVRGAAERFPPPLYLRETDLTTPDLDIQAFAADVAGGASDPLDRLHRLLSAVHETIEFDPEGKEAAATAAEAFGVKRGVAQDLAHVFLAAARRLGAPARLVTGYLSLERPEVDEEAAEKQEMPEQDQAQTQTMAAPADDEAEKPTPRDPGHVWTEAHVPGLGWVGFDPVLGLCVTEAHVRVAIGLDHLGAAPARGSRYGGLGEEVTVRIAVEDVGARRFSRRL